MANPAKQNSLLADKDGKALLGSRQTLVADTAAISTGTLTVTYTSGSAPTANDALTVADSTTPTVVELLEYCAELHNLITELKTDVTNVRTTLLAALDVIEAHGLMADA